MYPTEWSTKQGECSRSGGPKDVSHGMRMSYDPICESGASAPSRLCQLLCPPNRQMGTFAHSQPHATISAKSFCFSGNVENKTVVFGSPPALGAGGPRFKSARPDQSLQQVVSSIVQKPPFSALPMLCRNVAGCTRLRARPLQNPLQSKISEQGLTDAQKVNRRMALTRSTQLLEAVYSEDCGI